MTSHHQGNYAMPVFPGAVWKSMRILWAITMVLALAVYALAVPRYLSSLTGNVELALSTGVSLSTARFLLSVTGILLLLSGLVGLGLAALLFMRGQAGLMAFLASMYLIAEAVGSGRLASLDVIGTSTISYAQQGYTNLVLWPFWWLFPTGRFAPRWMRFALLPLLVLATVGWLTGHTIQPNQPSTPLSLIVGMNALLLTLSVPAVQVYRYVRVYDPVERQQAKWVVIGFAIQITMYITAVAIIGDTIDGPVSIQRLVGGAVLALSFMVVPIALALAVLRYRLWAVDVIIRRTLQYAIISILLASVYFGGIVLLQGLFVRLTGQESPLAVVASTLAIAALFNPVRTRVQAFIDRRFDRRKYDAQRTLDEFAASARDEVDIVKLEQSLLNVVNETMQPESVSLWVQGEG